MISTAKKLCFVILVLIANSLHSKASYLKPATDTTYPGKVLPNASLIDNTHRKYTMLIYARHTYSSIMLLDVDIRAKDSKLTVVQKLYNGKYTNTDSVIVNSRTLMPIESYSDINTSKDSFAYHSNRITGTMVSREESKAGSITNVDTIFPKPMFNGLIYAETYQALSYKKNKPVYLMEYVPGHNVKVTKINYIRDEDVDVSGLKVPAKVLEMRTGNIIEYVWLNAANQEVLKIEAKFPAFNYSLSRIL